jgi:tRNA G46 methylase TrmB
MTVLEIGGGSGGITIDIARRYPKVFYFLWKKIKKPVSSFSKTVNVLGSIMFNASMVQHRTTFPKSSSIAFLWRKWRFSILDYR